MPDEVSIGSFEAICAEYLTANRGEWAPRTTIRKLAAFKSFGTYLGHDKFLGRYKAPPAPQATPHPLPTMMEGVKTMLMEANRDSHRSLVVLCGFMGLRVSEARAVRPSHFFHRHNEHGETQTWLRVRGKGDRLREVPLSDEAYFILRPRIRKCTPDDTRLYEGGDSSARQLIHRLGKRAGLGNVSSHDLRHTAGTTFMLKSNLRTAQELLGHASPSQTATYTMVTSEAKMDAMSASTADERYS